MKPDVVRLSPGFKEFSRFDTIRFSYCTNLIYPVESWISNEFMRSE